jgi:hypothetical protein
MELPVLQFIFSCTSHFIAILKAHGAFTACSQQHIRADSQQKILFG